MPPSLLRSLFGSDPGPVLEGEPVAPGARWSHVELREWRHGLVAYNRNDHLPPLFNPGNFAGCAENLFGSIVSVNMFCVPAESMLRLAGLTEVAGPGDTWSGKPASLGVTRDG